MAMEKLDKKASKNVWKEIKDKPNVVGYSEAPAPRISEGEEVTDTKVIRVYVSKKVPKTQLTAKELVPRYITNGKKVYETDVVEIGEIKALSCCDPPPEGDIVAAAGDGRRDKHRPLVVGPSAMGVWEGSTACTLGGFAINKKVNEPEFIGILANNHCAARENKAVIGTAYIQPSPYDGGKMPDDLVGRLWRFVEITFNGYTCPYRKALTNAWRVIFPKDLANTVDIALVKLENGIAYTNEVHTVGKLNGKRDANVGDTVAKFGRTTGLTTGGKVTDISWSGRVQYSRGAVLFTDCILAEGYQFSQGGDSSSLTYTESDKCYIGNLFAGSDTHTIICKGVNVENLLEVEVLV